MYILYDIILVLYLFMKPSITIITASYNTDISIVKRCLTILSQQDYPKNKITHLVMDGGSTNGSIEIAQKFGCKVIIRKDLQQDAQTRTGVGVLKATADIILILEYDNFLTTKTWLSDMVQPFIDNPLIIGTFSAYNTFTPDMPILTRYCALFGINDPLVFFLGKSEKLVQYANHYNKGNLIKKTQSYDVISFTNHNLPTLGDNGHMVRTKAFQDVLGEPDKYLHTDMFMRLLHKGYNQYGVVYNSIIHYTGSSIKKFIAQRVLYKKRYYNNITKREYLVFDSKNPRDLFSLFMFIFFTITIMPNFILSLRGYLVKQDLAWFLHPIICWFTLVGYVKSELRLFKLR